MFFHIGKKKHASSEVTSSDIPQQHKWQGVKQRAMMRFRPRLVRRNSTHLTKSNSYPIIASEDRAFADNSVARINPDDLRPWTQARHASWPTISEQVTGQLPVSERDISKLFRRNTLDTVSSGKQCIETPDDNDESVSDVRLGEIHPEHTPEVVSSVADTSFTVGSSSGVVPDIQISSPGYNRHYSTPRAPPPTPWDTHFNGKFDDYVAQKGF
ncbi:hypothetical protein EIP91_001332 [Steccherinum ochraceum]|uniref:Uncharacterized protein n=1 Tax=Steccherinum ochraceum TaxID=92696 RepID=A0A4R0RH20_9APHY|nr:hypothetical protein EIP91_001332 [Steccherinum ochraceum]